MQTFEQRRFRRSLAVGVALTLVVCLVNQLGMLSALDDWFGDQRAIYAQNVSKRPDLRIEHIDIDDAALDAGAVGRWPWSHHTMARIVDEIGRANPLALGLDIYLSEPERPDYDAELADAFSRQKNLVLIADLSFNSDKNQTPALAAATRELKQDLELSPTDLLVRIRNDANGLAGIFDIDDLFVHARRSAMRDRVEKELRARAMDDSELARRLLPHTDQTINAPIIKVLREEAKAFRAQLALERFGFPVSGGGKDSTPTEFRSINLEMFTRSARLCGFVNYDMFKSSVVRSVPLFVQSDNRMYPQFGLTFACAVLGADPRKARVEKDRCIIPVPGREDLVIPTHDFYSTTLHRKVSSIIDIPWFGTSDFLTMYDWPSHTRRENHLSVNVVWDICRAVTNVENNNRELDTVMSDLFSDMQLDVPFFERYSKLHLAPGDSAAREKYAAMGLEKLNTSGLIEAFGAIPVDQRTAAESTQLGKLLDGRAALINLPKSNAGFTEQITHQRKTLSEAVEGKGVLFGWTAEGLADHVNTSLHLRCPGVVVHGVIADDVLRRVWWKRAPGWVGLVTVLLMGILVGLVVAWSQPSRAVLGTGALLLGYLFCNWFILFNRAGWLMPVAGPVVTIVVVWSGCTLQRVIYEGIERNRVATEVAIINREMDLARKVQAALIPTRAPEIPGLEASGWTMAASVAGGDCYDLWTLPDGRLGILLADASGHGLAPAMVVSQVRTLVRALCDVESHPHELLKRINTRVAEDLEPGRFVTAFLGFLSSDGVLEYASAGHGPQFWYGCDGEEMELLDSTGAPLGSDTEWLCDDPLPPIQMGAGCSLVVFSDGIFEAMTPAGELFGIDRLKEILHANRGATGKKILNLLTDAMQVWQNKRPPADDQTVVIARRIS